MKAFWMIFAFPKLTLFVVVQFDVRELCDANLHSLIFTHSRW